MRYILPVVLCMVFLGTFSSCKQCTECTKYPGPAVELCKKNYASTEAYDEAYRQMVAAGYRCN